MGEKSDSKKVSSPYVVLEDRPLDQWKVTELKEELKKRKLMTRGLKEELVKRLDEAVRTEMDEAKRNIENDLNSEAQPEAQSDDTTDVPVVAEKTTDVMDHTGGKNESLDKDDMVEELDNQNNDNKDVQMGMDEVQTEEGLQSLAEKMVTEGEGGIASTQVESVQVVQEISVETTVLASEGMVSEDLGGQESHMVGSENKDEVSNQQQDNGESKPESQSPEEEQAKPGASTQVESVQVVQEVSVETTVLVSAGMVSEELGGQETHMVGSQNKDELSNQQPDNGESKPESQSPEEEQAKPGASDLSTGNQVDEVSQVQSDSNSVDTISNTEKNELKDNVIAEGMVSEELGGQLHMVGNQNKEEVSNQHPDNGESKPESQSPEEEQAKPGASDLSTGNQVDEVSQVQSDSNSVDTISNTEKNELKDNVIADGVKLELDVKPEMVQPSFTNMAVDGSKSESVEVDEQHKDKAPAEEKDVNNVESMDVCKENDNVVADDVTNVVLDGGKSESVAGEEPLEDKVTAEEKYINNAENVDIFKKNDSGDVGSSEKLNLDRSSGDDSMDEDPLESKQIDSKFSSDEVRDINEKIIKEPLVKGDDSVHVMVEDATADKNFTPIEDKIDPSLTSTKRKPHDQEAAENSEVVKRQRRWNSEGLKVPEQHVTNRSASTTPKDAFQTAGKRTFSRSESAIGQELPKERVVPPSSKPPTTSLRIDHFLRPFTLKAVQELLGKTGTVVSFWMDHIKTHCYVTYASVEEAIETRNAVCNLRWPVNGGRLLMADFVDPQEVKNRLDAPLPSPTIPVSNIPPATMQPPQPSPRLQVQKQQLPPPPSLPPPPPLSNPPPARERALPPPPPPEKVDPPIVTLDDLFRKTRATPRIYYLPLSDEQVAAKLNAKGKPVKQ